MRGAIPPLPNTPSSRSSQLRKAKGQPYLYLYDRNSTADMMLG